MSSAIDPDAPSIGSKQHSDASLKGFISSASATTRKRKFDDSDLQSPPELGEPFTIETASNAPSVRPFRLVPKLLTSRSCLPLSYLDPNGIGDQSASTRIFSARNASLEANLHGFTFDQPLLIATSGAKDERLFAIERTDTGLYALCRLAQWVTLKALEKLRLQSQDWPPLAKQPCTQYINHGKSIWWRSFAVTSVSDVQNSHHKKVDGPSSKPVRLCMGMPHQPALDPPPIIIQNAPDGDASGNLELQARPVANGDEDLQPALPDPAEALSTIRAQYQEALYLSRSSLAYFAKGPLSRARAAFSSSSSPTENTSTLVQYLRSSILTLAVMDQKYKDALPSVINSLPAGNVSEDDTETVIATLQKKSRKTKKDKISKEGLYQGEEINIARWWLNRYGANLESGISSREDALKELLLKQRARETQLQIILVLETLALEAAGLHQNKDGDQLDVPVDGAADSQTKKKKRAKKPQDLNTQLDLLVDRLSIWQSMRLEEAKDSASDSHTNITKGLSADEGVSADHLKSFCVDVVLPFYGGRLPETTAMLCQKLGGPKVQSPPRPPLLKAESSSRLAEKPVAATAQRPSMKKPRRTLERVLTEEKISRSRPPSLSRSATDSALPGLKREVSDTSLSTIPLNRVTLQKSRRYSQREVDLKVVTQAAEAKLKKKAKIEQELQGAIAALKKPNPRMAVRELVEAAEKRAIGSNSRKSKNPVRNLFAQGVQVTATPKGNRRKDVFGGLPPLPAPTISTTVEPEEIPPSSAFKVPNSVQKLSVDRTEHKEPRLPVPFLRPSIEQTPTRGPSKRSKSLLSIPQNKKPSSIPLTPSKSGRSVDQTPQPSRSYHSLPASYEQGFPNSDIQETPQKPQIGPPSLDLGLAQPPLGSSPPDTGLKMLGNGQLPNIPSSPPVMEEESSKSIYETLGWDDYVDELS